MRKRIRSSLWVRRLYRKRWFCLTRNLVKDLVQQKPVDYPILDDRSGLDVAEPVLSCWPGGYAKPIVGLVRDRNDPPYWTKYERYLSNNGVPFDYYDVHLSSWLAGAQPFDVVVWAVEGVTPEIEEHKRKVFLLEAHCGKACFPSFETLMWNEDKIYQYDWLKLFGFPVMEAFVSHSVPETFDRIRHCEYPLVTKVATGAGSLGVELIKNEKHAAIVAGQAFSPVGRRTTWPYLRQKGYVYFQRFVPRASYDLRVIVVGNRVFGYYRDVPHGEFRASGMGLVRKEALPEDAVRLAISLKQKLGLVIAAVDMLRDADGNLRIIEVQANIEVLTAEQLHVNGIPGAYLFDSDGVFRFEPCKLWIQELALDEFLKSWISTRQPCNAHGSCGASQ